MQEVVAEPDLQELMDVIKQEALEETVQLLVLADRLSQELAAEAELEVMVMLLAEALDQADLAAVEPRVLEMQVAEQVLVLRILEEAAAVAAVHHHQLTTKTQEVLVELEAVRQRLVLILFILLIVQEHIRHRNLLWHIMQNYLRTMKF